jgi:hypothetical protein
MLSEQDWITTPHIPLDHRGPMDRPFTPFGDPANAAPIIERLQGLLLECGTQAVVSARQPPWPVRGDSGQAVRV